MLKAPLTEVERYQLLYLNERKELLKSKLEMAELLFKLALSDITAKHATEACEKLHSFNLESGVLTFETGSD